MKCIKVDNEARAQEEYLVLEMSNKYKEETGLAINIWIDEAQWYIHGKHSKRVKFQLDYSDDIDSDNLGSMGLDGTIFTRKDKLRKLRKKDLIELRNFVLNNRYVLDLVADKKLHLYKIWADIIKGGQPATQEAIDKLNARADELVEEKKRKRQ